MSAVGGMALIVWLGVLTVTARHAPPRPRRAILASALLLWLVAWFGFLALLALEFTTTDGTSDPFCPVPEQDSSFAPSTRRGVAVDDGEAVAAIVTS